MSKITVQGKTIIALQNGKYKCINFRGIGMWQNPN
jgi:hypothetical protein